MSAPDRMAPDPALSHLMARDLAVLEARIFGRIGFTEAARRAGTSRQQAEWICRRLHPIRREKGVA